MSSVLVVGAGVIGLTCADVLLANGHDVKVVYAEPPSRTTSAKASAIWHVYLVDPNDERNLSWSRVTLSRLLEIAAGEPDSGVFLVTGIELFREGPPRTPSWASIPPMFRMLEASEVPRETGAEWGYEISAPFAIMADYLSWLMGQVVLHGGVLEQRHVSSLAAESIGFDFVVNATGLGARSLVGDDALQGVKGQYLVMEWPEGVGSEYVGYDEHPQGMTYVMPRRSDIVIGGTEEYGIEDEVFTVSEDEMIARCSSIAPWLGQRARVKVVERVVGVRPFRRSGVRMERVAGLDSVPVIHCYGHGGSGFSLSWGCAESVAIMVGEG